MKGTSLGTGVWGESQTWMGVYGHTSSATGGVGVMGESSSGEGVRGASHGPHGGVVGVNDWAGDGSPGSGGTAGYFESTNGEGVRGTSHGPHGGVVGVNDWAGDGSPGSGGTAGWFSSTNGEGIRGTSTSPNHGGVVGVNSAGGDAGYFAGNVTVTGDVVVQGDVRIPNADAAEDFDVAEGQCVTSGMVVVLDHEGALRPSSTLYDTRVAGVISGAGAYKPGIILDRHDGTRNRAPLALFGKVFCNATDEGGPIRVGDLLTTSSTPGYAMRVTDRNRAVGAIVGKALRPLATGRALLPILVTLQ